MCRGLLQKDKTKRLDIETVLNMEWFAEFKSIAIARKTANEHPELISKFEAYTMTSMDDNRLSIESQ